MQRNLLILLALLSTTLAYSQTYEVGFAIGTSNYIGDIGNTNIINPTDVGFGIIAKWNRSKRHSFRFSTTYIPLSADDTQSSDPLREIRGYKFDNSVKELSLGIEYTFWEWDLHTAEKQFTPYLYTGITVINHGGLARKDTVDALGAVTLSEFLAFEDTWNMAIPIVLGAKKTIGRHFILSFELGARYSFTDNLDGSKPDNLNLPNGSTLSFGNLNNNDWYFFNALSLTYTFGRKPCYCIF